MANKIEVNTTKLGQDADNVGTYIKNIKNKMKAMMQSMKELDSMWEGPSSEAFKKAVYQDMQDMATIIEGLESINSYERNAKKKYEDCEKSVSAIISEIKI